MSLKHILLAVLVGLPLARPSIAEIPDGPITLEQCIKIALENNLNLRVTNYQPRLSKLNLDGVYSAYDPNLSLRLNEGNSVRKARVNPLEFTSPTSETDSFFQNFGLSGLLPSNTSYGISLRGSESTGASSDGTPFGSYGTSLDFNLTQPLLRGAWSGNSVRMNIKMAKKNVEASSLDVKSQIIQTIASVESAFYNLLADRQNLTIAENSLKNAQEDLRIMKIKTEVGTEAKTRLPQLEAEVYSRQASLISVKNSFTTQLNTLKSLMSDDFAEVIDKDFSPVGQLNPVQTVFSRSDSWDKALNTRPDILKSAISLERADITLKYRKNQLYPQLDLNASYGFSGADNAEMGFINRSDGKVLDRPIANPLYNPIVERELEIGSGVWRKGPKNPDLPIDNRRFLPSTPFISRDASFNRSFRDIQDGDYSNYNVGITLRIPIPNRAARANYKTAQVQKEIFLLQHKQLEQSIMINIDSLIRSAESSFERIEATRLARVSGELAVQNERTLRDEGASTDFVVLRAERDLTSRRYSEIRAKADYMIALVRLTEAEGSILDKHGINVEFVEE